MLKEVVTKNDKGVDVKLSVVGEFKINELNKEFIIYSLVDEDDTNEDGHLLIGDVLRENDDVKDSGIKKSEKDLVMAYYNERASQIIDD